MIHPAINSLVTTILLYCVILFLVASIYAVTFIPRHLLSLVRYAIPIIAAVAIVVFTNRDYALGSIQDLSCSFIPFAMPASLCPASIDHALVTFQESIPRFNELIWDESSKRMASENIQRLQVIAERLIPRAGNSRIKESKALEMILGSISYTALDVLNELHRYEVKIAKQIHHVGSLDELYLRPLEQAFAGQGHLGPLTEESLPRIMHSLNETIYEISASLMVIASATETGIRSLVSLMGDVRRLEACATSAQYELELQRADLKGQIWTVLGGNQVKNRILELDSAVIEDIIQSNQDATIRIRNSLRLYRDMLNRVQEVQDSFSTNLSKDFTMEKLRDRVISLRRLLGLLIAPTQGGQTIYPI